MATVGIVGGGVSRYRVVLRWTGPKPAPNKYGLVTYVLDLTGDDTAEHAVRYARRIAPGGDGQEPGQSQHWEPLEIWVRVPLPTTEKDV